MKILKTLFQSPVPPVGEVVDSPVDWKGTCEVLKLRIDFLEDQLREVSKDRDLYRDKCFGFMFPNSVGGTVTTVNPDPVPLGNKRKSLLSMQRELEIRDRREAADMEKKLAEKK